MDKIVYFINSGGYGGAEMHALDLAKGMRAKGYRVYLVAPDGPLIPEYRATGIPVINDRPRLDIDPFFIRRMIQFLRQEKIEIVHTHQLKTTINGILAAYLAGVPIRIAHIHDTILQWEIPWYKKIVDVIINTAVTNLFATHSIALTPKVKEWLIKGEHIDKRKIVVIPNGVDVERFKPLEKGYLRKKLTLPSQALLVGTVGRLTVEKGQIFFLQAINRLVNRSHRLTSTDLGARRIKFVLIGEGEEGVSLSRYLREQRLEDWVSLLGFQPEVDKVKLLSDLDVFVFPSRREGFGIAMLEAMACGRPVVAAGLEKGLMEIADEKSALFFKPLDSSDLAEKLWQLIEDPHQRAKLSRNARRQAEKYSLANLISNYDKLYQACLSSLQPLPI